MLILFSEETYEAVKEWLVASGINTERIEKSGGLNWIKFNATADEAESLLKTEYNVYEHSNGQKHVACEEYSLPSHLKEKVDFVLPSVHFDMKLKQRSNDDALAKRDDPVAKAVGQPGSWSTPKLGELISKSKIIKELEDCDVQITPDCLRALYKFGPNLLANSKNSFGIVEYTPQSYLPSDLDLFFQNFSTKQVGNRPIFDSIDGGVLQTIEESFDYNGKLLDTFHRFSKKFRYPMPKLGPLLTFAHKRRE